MIDPKSWDDYIIPLYDRDQHKELQFIKENLLKFETLIHQDSTQLKSLQHDVIFTNIISKVDKLQRELSASLAKQLNFLYNLQLLFIFLFSVYSILSILYIRGYRKKRKAFLINQETLIEKLKQGNYFLKESQKISKLGYYIYNFKTQNWEASQTILDILNFKNPKASIQLWFDIVHPEDIHILKNALEKRQKDYKAYFDITYRVIRPKDNKILWIHHTAAALKKDADGNLLPVLGIIQDITAQKETELNLIKTYEIAQMGTFTIDLISRKVTRSKLFNKIVEFNDSEEITVDDWCKITHPDDLLSNRELLQNSIKTKKTLNNEFRIFTNKNHKLIWLQGYGEIFYNKDTPTKLVGAFMDITKRKLAEIKSAKNETMLTQAQKIAKIGSFNLYFNLQKGSISKEYGFITGFDDRKEISFKEWRNLVHPEDLNGNDNMLNKCINEGLAFDREFRIYPKDSKTYKWIHGKGKIFFKDNKPSNFIGTIQDITDSKFNAIKLLDATNKLHMAQKIAQLGVLTFDFSKGYFESTDIFDNIVGISKNYKKDFEGWLKLVYPEDIKKLQGLGFDSKITEIPALEFRMIRPLDKKIIWVIGNGKKEFDSNGKFVKFTGTIQDISKKRKLERDFLHAFIDAQEQEKQSFGEELHDGMSQILAAENMYIETLLKINKDKTGAPYKHLLTLKDLNISAIDEARNIAHGLMSKQLKEKGLLEALIHICKDYNHSKNIEFKFVKKDIVESEIAKEIKINLFRLTQEISTNIIRHSGATTAHISIKKTPKNKLELIIKDNGVGMDLEKLKQEKRGAGLKNIERRVTLLNGNLSLESKLDLGTTYTIEVPLEIT